MRVNVYAEEITERVEIIEKTTRDGTFTGVRFYLELPITINKETNATMKGPFIHHKDDDDSGAVTFWGKKNLRTVLQKALDLLDKHHAGK